MHIYMMLQYHNYPKEVRRKISLGIKAIIQRFSMSPYRDCSLYVASPVFSEISYGPRQIFWNLECFPLASLDISHFKTRSPTWKCLSLETCLSNHLLILCWWIWNFSFALFLSSNFKRVWIWVWRKLEDRPREDWASWSDGNQIFGGRIASLP